MKRINWLALLLGVLIAISLPVISSAGDEAGDTTQPTTAPTYATTEHVPNRKSVCYICDGSGSMIGGKDKALRVELKKAVSRLLPTQSFNFFIFQEGENNKMFQSLDTKLLMANDSNKNKLYDFLDNKLAFHGVTNPIPAMEEAWRENPRLVYLLTDGEFDDPDSATVMAKIKELNDARKDKGQPIIKINTILMVGKRDESYPDFEALMKKIAEDSGGVYLKTAAEDLNPTTEESPKK